MEKVYNLGARSSCLFYDNSFAWCMFCHISIAKISLSVLEIYTALCLHVIKCPKICIILFAMNISVIAFAMLLHK